MAKTTLALVWLVGMSGCFVDLDGHHRRDRYYDDGDYYDTALLHVYWTVDDTTDPGACRAFGATDISLLIETSSGGNAGEIVADCRDFETEIELDPGRYYVNAVLLDGRGDELTTSLDLPSLSLSSGEYHDVTVEFPADAFY